MECAIKKTRKPGNVRKIKSKWLGMNAYQVAGAKPNALQNALRRKQDYPQIVQIALEALRDAVVQTACGNACGIESQ